MCIKPLVAARTLVKIFLAAQAAIPVRSSFSVSSQLSEDFSRELDKVSDQFELAVICAPGEGKIYGNETAVELARCGPAQKVSQAVDMVAWLRNIKSIIIEIYYSKAKQRW